MSNSVQFKHFCGTQNKWRDCIDDQTKWVDSVVFARVLDRENNEWKLKIFAGRRDIDGELVNYIYDIVSSEELLAAEERLMENIDRIDNIIHIDPSTNRFTNPNFVEAIQYVIEDKVDSSLNDLLERVDLLERIAVDHEDRIQVVEDAILWENKEEI